MRTYLSLIIFAAGCSQDPSMRTVSGQLDVSTMRVADAQVLATATDGRAWRAAILADGRFSLDLPVGTTYRMTFANPTSNPNNYSSFAVLVSRKITARVSLFTLTGGDNIELGRVAPLGVTRST